MTHSITTAVWAEAKPFIDRLAEFAKALTLQGRVVRITVAAAKRTLPQNKHIHPVVERIARDAGRSDVDDVRALLVEQWRHETSRPKQYKSSLDGLRMVDVSNSTKELDKPECSEFIDWLLAWEAQA